MKIALYQNLPPGGARRMLYEVVRRSAAEHEYHVFRPELGGDHASTHLPSAGYDLAPFVEKVHSIPVPGGRSVGLARRSPLRPVVDAARITEGERAAARLIDADDYDLAVVHSCQFTHSPSLLRHLRTPSLYFLQEPRRRSFESGYRTSVNERSGLARTAWRVGSGVFEWQLRRRDRAAVGAATALACNSAFTRESIARAYGRDARVCHLGVDPDLFAPGAGAGERDAGADRSVVSVGALDPSKGHTLVVAALALVPAGRRPALDVVYERRDAGYERELRRAADVARVELRLHRGITDPELVALYRRAIATVAAAHLEPFGLTPLESMSTGTPVVAVCEGGYRETVTSGENGYLVERTPSALAAGIDRVGQGELGRGPDEIRETVVPRWSWDVTVARLHELYAEAAPGVGR